MFIFEMKKLTNKSLIFNRFLHGHGWFANIPVFWPGCPAMLRSVHGCSSRRKCGKPPNEWKLLFYSMLYFEIRFCFQLGRHFGFFFCRLLTVEAAAQLFSVKLQKKSENIIIICISCLNLSNRVYFTDSLKRWGLWRIPAMFGEGKKKTEFLRFIHSMISNIYPPKLTFRKLFNL